MPRRRLLWQLLPPFLLLVLVPLALLLLFTAQTVRNFQLDRMREELLSRTVLASQLLEPLIAVETRELLLARAKEAAHLSDVRITVIGPSGEVMAETAPVSEDLNNHADRPEVLQALAGQPGTAYRFSHTLQSDMVYAAIPVLRQDEVLAVVRLALPIENLLGALREVYLRILLLCAALATVTGLAGWFLLRRFARPLERLRDGAERFAHGDFSERVPVPATREIAGVADALNQMATLLNDRIELVVQQRNEQDAVLASMVEGVLAVDNDGRIISLNPAAAALLSTEFPRVAGQPLQAVVRNSALQHLIEDTLRASVPLEREVVLHAPAEQTLQAHGAVLRDATGSKIGAVVVLNDITRLRRLERVRRDFVANVSHELRTPITAIKGFVETLLTDGRADAENTQRFLEITAKQADRLSAIIDDLLILSRLEQEDEPLGLLMRPHKVASAVRAAAQACEPLSAQKGIRLEEFVDANTEALFNPPLFEQCLINLLENAIKYSESGQAVRIEAEVRDSQVLIRVRDKGCGISSEHLTRIFERFYRIDKSRSRRLGGTGLGLAIVKHIAQAHGGTVSVQSKVGAGSTFTVTLRAH